MNKQKANQRDCRRVDNLLGAYVFDDLGAGERTRVERHLAGCESCRTAVEEMRGAVRAVEAELAGEPTPVLSASRREMLAMLPPVRRRAAKWFWFSGSPSVLLVQAAAVLAVLAVLGSLLLPAGNRARQRAQNVSMAVPKSLEEYNDRLAASETEVNGRYLAANRRASAMSEKTLLENDLDGYGVTADDQSGVGQLSHDMVASESLARPTGRAMARPGQPVAAPAPVVVAKPSPPPSPPPPATPAPGSQVVANGAYHKELGKARGQADTDGVDLAGWLGRTTVESAPVDAPVPSRPAAKSLGQVAYRDSGERERRQAGDERQAKAERADVGGVVGARLADEEQGLGVDGPERQRERSLSLVVPKPKESGSLAPRAESRGRLAAETRENGLPRDGSKLDQPMAVAGKGVVVSNGGVFNEIMPGDGLAMAVQGEFKQAEELAMVDDRTYELAVPAVDSLSFALHGGRAEGKGDKDFRVAEVVAALQAGKPGGGEEALRAAAGERRDERLLDDFKRQLRGEEVAESATLEQAAGSALVATAAGRLVEEKPASGPALPMAEETQLEVVVDVDGDFADVDLPLPAPVFAVVPPNPFVLTANERLSTFALDTDTASYAIARNYLRHGSWPPAGAIRVEEFVNSFDYNYPRSGAGVFAVHAAAAASPFRPGLTLLKIGVQGKVVGREGRKPAHFVFVVDSSGSMARRDRLPLVQYALGLLVDQLAASDRVTLITYGAEPRLVLEHVAAGERQAIVEAIQAIQCGGSTNLYSAVKLAYDVAARRFQAGAINRIILCSDGATNVGPVDAEELLAQVERFRQQGVGFTSIGFGLGNYNDAVLEALAKRGDGNYLFVASQGEARQALVERLGATVQHIAKDAKIQVEFNPQRVRRYRLLGYEKRAIANDDFRNDAVDAGEVGSGQSATALYEVELLPKSATDERLDLGTVYIRYRDLESGQVEEIAQRLDEGVLQVRTPQDSPHFFLAAGAAEFAELLRGEGAAERAAGSLADLRHLLEQVVVALPLNDQARQLLALVRRAENLR